MDENLGLFIPRTIRMWGTFHVRFFEFSLESFSALCKISDVKIFKRLLLPVFMQFQQNSMESMVIGGGAD